MTGRYEFQSDFAKKYISIGLEQGREQGREEGLARALLTVLAGRGLDVDDETRGRVMGTHDAATLEAWIRRALGASSLADVFTD